MNNTYRDYRDKAGCFVYPKREALFILVLFLIFTTGSCKKYLEVAPPKDVLVRNEVFSNDASATSAVVGIYSQMMTQEQVFSGSATIDCGLYADELNYTRPGNQFITGRLTSDNSEVGSAWSKIYNYIYGANAVLEGLNGSTKISPAVKTELTGEAKFIRAFGYFYLVNLFGDVPLVTTTDYNVSSKIARTPSDQVYRQIIADLTDAQNLLPADYSVGSGEKVRPNKWAATALLARVYLYTKDWNDAETTSAAVIQSNLFTPLPVISSAFLKDNTEAIWQLMPVVSSLNTFEGQFFIPVNGFAAPKYPLTDSLVQAFEPGDQRLSGWVGSVSIGGTPKYYPFKYKVRLSTNLSEYYTVLRLGEQYLIHAEAAAENNKLAEAIDDLNVLRARAGLSPLTAVGQSQVLTLVMHERRVELFSEWGHRWFDLKRTGQASVVMPKIKTGWTHDALLWPLPVTQINANPALTQNPGY